MISLEMIGYFAPSQRHRALLLPSSTLTEAISSRWWAVGRPWPGEGGEEVHPGRDRRAAGQLLRPRRRRRDLSDHLNYWAAGFPAFMIRTRPS